MALLAYQALLCATCLHVSAFMLFVDIACVSTTACRARVPWRLCSVLSAAVKASSFVPGAPTAGILTSIAVCDILLLWKDQQRHDSAFPAPWPKHLLLRPRRHGSLHAVQLRRLSDTRHRFESADGVVELRRQLPTPQLSPRRCAVAVQLPGGWDAYRRVPGSLFRNSFKQCLYSMATKRPSMPLRCAGGAQLPASAAPFVPRASSVGAMSSGASAFVPGATRSSSLGPATAGGAPGAAAAPKTKRS